MKKFFFKLPGLPVLLISFLLFSCVKEETDMGPIVDPVFNEIISKDTLRSGGYMGVSIGDDYEAVYNKVQKIGAYKKITTIGVTGEPFSGIEQMKNKIHLYEDLRLSDKNNSSRNILFSIVDNKIAAIYDVKGEKLNKWPSVVSSVSINLGDEPNVVYKKLLVLQSVIGYKNYFTAITAHSKLLNQPYDDRMSKPSMWYMGFINEEKQLEVITYMFNNKELQEIYITKQKNTSR